MNANLLNKTVAVLVTDGFEQAEVEGPMRALHSACANPKIVAPRAAQVQGMRHDEKGDEFKVDTILEEASSEEFDALLLPGGLFNPDELRGNGTAVSFVQAMAAAGKPIAAICHGPQLLIEADLVNGKRLTSWPSLATDIRNAGGEWVDDEVVVDGQLVTSRQPDDILAFNREMIEVFSGGSTTLG